MKYKDRLCSLIVMALLLILNNSCKEDEAPSVIKDGDGNVYTSVTIGTLVWMVENLKTTKYNNGEHITGIIDNTTWSNLTTPGYCWYNNDINNKYTDGALYNWYAVSTNKVCPTGWHVPTDAEWTTMENYLIANGFNYDGTTTDNKIAKALVSTSGWASSSNPGDVGNTDYPKKRNATGFTALPGGARNVLGGTFDDIGYFTCWWSATEATGQLAAARVMDNESSKVQGFGWNKDYGFSVRCVRD